MEPKQPPAPGPAAGPAAGAPGAPAGAPEPFDKLCLDVLKSIGKTLGQMNLYNASHPAVKAIMAETIGVLAEILAQAKEGVLAYSLDAEKVIANGRIVGALSTLPTAVPGLFARFKLHSVTFKTGVKVEELSAFCQLAALRPESAKGLDAAKALAEQNVVHIVLNEAIYAKVEKDVKEEKAVEVAQATVTHVPSAERTDNLVRTMKDQSVDQAIRSLVQAANLTEVDQQRIMEVVMERVREDVQRRVNEATKELVRQKTLAENDAARSQAVVQNQANGVIVVDEQGKILMMNPEAEELFGKKMADVAGKPLAQNIGGEHLVSMAKEIRTPGDRAIKPDVQTAGTADSTRTLRASTAVIQNEAGKTVGVLSALSDQAKHREIDKMEREFVAHVTHELRAPLTSIKAALEILDSMFKGRLKEDEARMMNNAMRNSERLEDLIRGILDFSKIESGQMTVYPKPYEADKLARESAETMVPWAQKKGLKLSVEAASGLPRVNTDVPRTTQVIVNLLSNAIKFTPKQGSITVRVVPGEGGDSKAVLYSVEDTGAGIPKEEQAKIFEKFVQIAAGEQHIGGTGLGLAIAKALIHLQNGRMWVESTPGKGARFYFTLPHYVPPADAQPGAPKAAPRPWWKRLLGIKA